MVLIHHLKYDNYQNRYYIIEAGQIEMKLHAHNEALTKKSWTMYNFRSKSFQKRVEHLQ